MQIQMREGAESRCAGARRYGKQPTWEVELSGPSASDESNASDRAASRLQALMLALIPRPDKFATHNQPVGRGSHL